MEVRPGVLREIGAFLWQHKLEALLLPLWALTVATLLHELGHAVFVWVQGGIVHDLSFAPEQAQLGQVSYRLPAAGRDWLVSLGPFLLWLGCLLTASAAIFQFSRGKAEVMTRGLYVWLFVVPLGDVVWHALPWMGGAENDIFTVLGPPNLGTVLGVWLVIASLLMLGYAVMRQGYGTSALSPIAYALLSLVALALVALFGSP
jgi:hypothetical protein